MQTVAILTVRSPFPDWPHLLLVGIFIGALVVTFRQVAARYIRSAPLVALCVVLFMFASPLAQSNWIVYSGIPTLVPLFTCAAFLLYFAARDRARLWPTRFALTGLLMVVVVVSSWYREFTIAFPITMLAMELVHARRITASAVVAAALVVPCAFPTLLPYVWFRLTSDLPPTLPPFVPVFALGKVGEQLSAPVRFRPEVSRHLMSIPSPTLLIVGFAAFVAGTAATVRRARMTAAGLRATHWLAVAGCIAGAAALIGMAVVSSVWPYHFGTVAVLLIAASIDLELAVWSALFIAPFYRVYTERVHLAYVMVPLSIAIVVAIQQAWRAIDSAGRRTRAAVHGALVVAMVVAVCDALSNAVAVRMAMAGISEGIETVAKEIKRRPSDRPVAIIGNALHVDDLRLYLDAGYQLLWTIPGGHPRPEDVVETTDQLAKFLNAKLLTTDVYLLDVRHDYLPTKRDYHYHRFVEACSVPTDAPSRLHLTRISYLMPDPLRWFVKRDFQAFFGPPDLVDDFYYGASDRPLFGKIEVEYVLYKVTGAQVKRWLPEGPVTLIDGNRRGFSVVLQNRRYFAVPIAEGPFSYERVCRHEYSRPSFEASTLEELDAMLRTAG